jgi:hypothetical protein
MLELIFTACSVLSAQSCREVALIYSMEDVSLMQCQMSGQYAIAEWTIANPNWITGRWQCRVAGRYAKA